MERSIITLCGSTKFKDDFLKINAALTKAGFIVLMPGVFGHAGDPVTSQEKEALDILHKDKIAMSNRIVVVNRDNYIGESTRAEIKYAESLGKEITYWF